jgi:hypothetical protein
MSTAAQKSANVSNSHLSTGPRTEQGKQKAAKNSAKHYLTAKQVVVPGENPDEYNELHHDLEQSWNPANPQESLLVEQIAQNAWRLMRVRRLEAATFESFMPRLQPSASSFQPRSPDRPPADDGKAMMRAFHENAKAFDNLRRYATPIERAYHNAIAELTKLQKERKKCEIGSVSQSPAAPEPSSAREQAFHSPSAVSEFSSSAAATQSSGNVPLPHYAKV